MRRFMIAVAVIVGAMFVALGALWGFQRRLIYFPSRDLPDVHMVLPGALEVAFETDDGLTLSGWYLPATTDESAVTIVVFNGNAGNRGGRIPLAKALFAEGYNVFLFDYRGYGGNAGRPSEKGLLTDGAAAVAYAGSLSGVDPGRLVYFGESLGAGVAIGTAENSLPAALILRSPFASLEDTASIHYPFLPVSLLLKDRYPNVDRLSGMNVPSLVVAGSQDRTVPMTESQRIFDAAPEPKAFVLIEGADHNDPRLSFGVELIDAIDSFLTEIGIAPDS